MVVIWESFTVIFVSYPTLASYLLLSHWRRHRFEEVWKFSSNSQLLTSLGIMRLNLDFFYSWTLRINSSLCTRFKQTENFSSHKSFTITESKINNHPNNFHGGAFSQRLMTSGLVFDFSCLQFSFNSTFLYPQLPSLSSSSPASFLAWKSLMSKSTLLLPTARHTRHTLKSFLLPKKKKRSGRWFGPKASLAQILAQENSAKKASQREIEWDLGLILRHGNKSYFGI